MFLPRVLVLGPGGIKSLLILGALFRLNQGETLSTLSTYVGVSAGSLISLLLVAGYTVQEIVLEAVSEDLLQDASAVNFSTSLETMGLVGHSRIREKLSEKIKVKFGKVLTLKQLYLATGLNYVSVASNLTKEEPHYFSHQSDPDLSCVEAALYSMNIPFIFQKLNYQDSFMVDGALTDPLPIAPFDDGETDILAVSVSSSGAGQGLLRYFNLVIQAPSTMLKRLALTKASNKVKHMDINCFTLDVLGMTLDPAAKAKLLYLGYEEGEKFLQQLQEGEASQKEEVSL